MSILVLWIVTLMLIGGYMKKREFRDMNWKGNQQKEESWSFSLKPWDRWSWKTTKTAVLQLLQEERDQKAQGTTAWAVGAQWTIIPWIRERAWERPRVFHPSPWRGLGPQQDPWEQSQQPWVLKSTWGEAQAQKKVPEVPAKQVSVDFCNFRG